jgi:hypothetical protein
MSELVQPVAKAIWDAREASFPACVRRYEWDEIDASSGARSVVEAQALAAIAAVQEWQPIATAPTNGKPLLLIARAKTATASGILVGWHLQSHGWVELSFTGPVGIVPSAWMPLPGFPSPPSSLPQPNETEETKP